MMSRDAEKSTEMLGYVLTFAVLSPFASGLVAIAYSLWRHFRPPGGVFGMFLCHHKGSAGCSV